ncbi:MAG TPA: hypothetical protein VFH78_14600 [Candidatus Thermoplasmatota archaeon]|nr:hypothetical protein [Candidatus Thermoplasmatota archaeon]
MSIRSFAATFALLAAFALVPAADAQCSSVQRGAHAGTASAELIVTDCASTTTTSQDTYSTHTVRVTESSTGANVFATESSSSGNATHSGGYTHTSDHVFLFASAPGVGGANILLITYHTESGIFGCGEGVSWFAVGGAAGGYTSNYGGYSMGDNRPVPCLPGNPFALVP